MLHKLNTLDNGHHRFCIHQYASGHDHSHGVTAAQHHIGSPRDIENGNRHLASNAGSYSEDDGLSTGDPGSSGISQPGDYFSVASSSSSKTVTMRDRRSSDAPAVDPMNSASPAFSTFVGLLFHALADGISLGAASAFSSSTAQQGTGKDGHDDGDDSLSLIIFLSLIIHKAPVAFSLSSLLMSQYSTAMQRAYKSNIKRALGIFSLATPIGALTTWLLLRLISLVSWSESVTGEAAEEDGNVGTPLSATMQGRMVFWSEHGIADMLDVPLTSIKAGMALLFSAGTFLFVSTHVMAGMESPSSGTTPQSAQNGHHLREELPELPDSPQIKSSRRITLFLAGMLTPFVLSIAMGHRHGH